MTLIMPGKPGEARYEFAFEAPPFRLRVGPHPAPPRLLPMIDDLRSGQPELVADCEPSRDPRILAPGHVVTGSLRRGFMASMVFNPAAWA